MNRVGIRELKQNASAVIKRVASGEAVEVTERGRPVAKIVPLRAESVLDQMTAEGTATVAQGDILDVKPARQAAGAPTLSSVLAGLRAHER